MRQKHLFMTVAMAAVLASCSQDELTVANNEMQDLGNRPMVEAPVIRVGGSESRMTTTGLYAGVEWAAGDGFGAAVMDIYNEDGKTFEEKFTVVDYINSNVLFQTDNGTDFYADASMPEGNHLFYAPFNKDNISRAPLATQLPLLQVVKNPSSNVSAPSNDIITAFYEDGKYPVFVAYDQVYGTPKTSLALEMRHIYSLPMVTLKLGNVQLLGEDGQLKTKVTGVDEDGNEIKEAVYEESITIDKIVFAEGQIKTKGAIKNDKVKELLKKTEENSSKVVWDAQKYEDAATADILMEETESEKIVVEFEGGQTLTTSGNNGYFFMVLPGADYSAEDLEVYVYATINGESYVSAETSLETAMQAISPAKEARLLPGLPYSADEYNKDGSMKNSKGSSMTYTVEGGFIPTATAEAPAIIGYKEIENYDELEDYINKVAYRGEKIQEITKAEAETMLTDGTYDEKKYFVVTATTDDPIELDKAIVETFINSCVISGKNASIEFLGGSKNLVLGDITWTEEYTELVTFRNESVYAKGVVVMQDAPATIKAIGGATVTLESENPVTVENDWNSTINVNSDAAHNITSIYGTVNVNVSTAANITNQNTSINDEIIPSKLVIADDVTTTGKIVNGQYGETEIYKAIVSMENYGTTTLKSNKSKVTVTGDGSVDNTVGGKVVNNGTNVVFATMGDMTDGELIGSYDALTGLNKIILNGTWTISGDLTLSSVANTTINTIDVEADGVIEMETAELDLTGVTVNIKANETWTGRDWSVSVIRGATFVETGTFKLTLVDINIEGYKAVVGSESDLRNYVAEGGLVTLSGDVTVTDNLIVNKDVTIDLDGNTMNLTKKGSIKPVTGVSLKISNGDLIGEGTVISSAQEGYQAKVLKLNNCNIKRTTEGTAITIKQAGEFEIVDSDVENGGHKWDNPALNIISSKGKLVNTEVGDETGNYGGVWIANSSVEITGGKFYTSGQYEFYLGYGGNKVDIKGGAVWTKATINRCLDSEGNDFGENVFNGVKYDTMNTTVEVTNN